MKKNTFLLIATACICCQGIAQQVKKTGSPISFRSINLVGMTEGEKGTAFQLQTINGVQYKGWFTGVGVGLDYYDFRSVPLFLDLRKDILVKKSTPFVYADGGVNYVWQTTSQKSMNPYSTFDNKFYYDLGIGYKASLGKENALVLSIGYGGKNILQKTTTPIYYYPTFYYVDYAALQQSTETYSYTLKRLSLKIGWEF